MAARTETFQSNIHHHTFDNLVNYALFMGGLNVTHDSLLQYDPLKTGFGRLFMVRQPTFLASLMPVQLRKFKHVLEYANTGVSGIGDITVDFEAITGGYAGRSFDIPMIAKDDTTSFTVKTYELSGSVMNEVLEMWITGTSDTQSGFSHYHGVDIPVHQANHTAEFIYVNTDQTGKRIEHAVQFANCFPKNLKRDHWNYEQGQHQLVPLDIEFTCTCYHSPQINEKAAQLLSKYNILMNQLDFNSGFKTRDVNNLPSSTLRPDQIGQDKDW